MSVIIAMLNDKSANIPSDSSASITHKSDFSFTKMLDENSFKTVPIMQEGFCFWLQSACQVNAVVVVFPEEPEIAILVLNCEIIISRASNLSIIVIPSFFASTISGLSSFTVDVLTTNAMSCVMFCEACSSKSLMFLL